MKKIMVKVKILTFSAKSGFFGTVNILGPNIQCAVNFDLILLEIGKLLDTCIIMKTKARNYEN